MRAVWTRRGRANETSYSRSADGAGRRRIHHVQRCVRTRQGRLGRCHDGGRRRAGAGQLQGAEDAVGRTGSSGHLERQRPAGHSDAARADRRHAIPAERRRVQAARRAARSERGQRQQRRVLAGARRGVRKDGSAPSVAPCRRRRTGSSAQDGQPRVLVRHRPAGRADSGVDARGPGCGCSSVSRRRPPVAVN